MAMAHNNSHLYEWIARASLPEERLGCDAFSATAHQDEVVWKSRCDSWDKRVAHADTQLLERRKLTREQWHGALRDVEVTSPQHLPDWAKTFIDLYGHFQHKVKPPTVDNIKFSQSATIWGELNRPWLSLQQEKLNAVGISLSDESADDLIQYLVQRLLMPLYNVFRAYPGAYSDSLEAYFDPEFWRAAFDRQPILVHIIGHLVSHWRTSTEEMLDRFIADLPRLQGRMLDDEAGEILVLRLRCGLGDPHRGGRSVAILETNHGNVVYKPKDLIGTWAAGLLLHELLHNHHQDNAEFVPEMPDFLYCRGYGWEECVAHRDCDAPEQVETFYRRLGGWLFLLQLLNGNDFWYDNLIACADQPYFIDYETIIGNSFEDFWTEVPANTAMKNFRALHMIGILPMLMPGSMGKQTLDGIDISVLAPPGKQRTPFDTESKFGDIFPEFVVSDYATYYDGEFRDITPFMETFIDGYQRMGRLLKSATGQHAFEQFCERIEDARFRHIVVDTWQCYALLTRLFSFCGHDGVRAGITLDGYFTDFSHYPVSIVAGMRKDFWSNDVPLYEMQANGLNVFNTDNIATDTDFFREPALAIVKRNYTQLPGDFARQTEYIKLLFSTRPDNPRREWGRGDDTTPPTNEDALLQLSIATGDRVVAIINSTEQMHDCLSVGRYQLTNDRTPQPLPLGVDGCSGILAFLATLQENHSGDYTDALQKCRIYLREDGGVSNSTSPLMYYTDTNSGVLSFSGAKLAALCRLARLDAFSDVVVDIEKLMETHRKAIHASDEVFLDYRHGVCGLLSRFTELETLFDRKTIDRWLEQILESLKTQPLRVSPPQTEAYQKYADAVLPGAIDGMQLTDRYMNGHELATHPGYLKLRATIQQETCAAKTEPATASQQPAQQPAQLRGDALLDHAYRALARADWPRAGQLTDEFARRWRDGGSWFPDNWADDRFLLSAIHGQADVGILLLSVRARANLNPFRAGQTG